MRMMLLTNVKEYPVNLYYSPGACSMIPHIILEELGMKYELMKVDLKEHTYAGGDFKKVNPKGQVPTLELDTKQVITENAVILQYLADLKPEAKLLPANGMERIRHLETLNFLTTDIHKNFGVLFNPKMPEEAKAINREILNKKFGILENQLAKSDYLMGNSLSLPDAYLFVMTRWAKAQKVNIAAYPNIAKHFDTMHQRPAVKKIIAQEADKK